MFRAIDRLRTASDVSANAHAVAASNGAAGMKAWAVPAALVVAVEYAVALAIGFRAGFHYSIPFDRYLSIGLVVAVGGSLIALLLRTAHLAWRQEERPIRRIASEAPKLAGFVAGVMLVTLQMAALSWLKVMIPLATSFWADPMLADLDKLLFGTDPWRLTHALVGNAGWIDTAYITWTPVKLWGVLILILMPESARKSQAMLSYFMVFSTGLLVAYLLPSAGPVFYELVGHGDRFAELPINPWVHVTASYLWADYLAAGGSIGTGISAMPSMHVAIAAWMALVLGAYLPRLKIFGWAYFAVILFGSVHLGWHYLLDGLVAWLGVVLIWRLVPSLFYERRGTLPASTIQQTTVSVRELKVATSSEAAQ